MNEEQFAAVALSRVAGIGPAAYRQLLIQFGTAAAALAAEPAALRRVPGISERIARLVPSGEVRAAAERIVDYADRNGVQILRAGDGAYPANLAGYDKAPPVLYHCGQTDLQRRRVLAVVGTRRISKEGARQIERMLDPLREYDPLIVSGLAYGIDTAAHRRALTIGLPTLAVLGSGLQYVYPATNRKLAREMSRRGGGLLTEYPHWVQPEREHFPARNRIVAMLADLTLVVESDRSGGSIITANMAHASGRKVGACPGRGGDVATAGCNELIKAGKAHLIDDSEDIVRILNWEPAAAGRRQLALFASLPPEQQQLAAVLRECDEPVHVDALQRSLDVPPNRLAGLLLTMEMEGTIAALPGRRYRMSAGGA